MGEHPQTKVQVLKGLQFQCLGRAADLLCMHFGSMHEITYSNGKTAVVGEWALHVDTTWRMISDSKIFVGNSDMNYQAGNGNFNDCDFYDWDIGGKSRFDEKAELLNHKLKDARTFVQGVKCSDVGDLKLDFQNGDTFQINCNISSDFSEYELWRLFEPAYESPHFVADTSVFNID